MKRRVGVGCIVLRDHQQEPVLLLRRSFGKFKNKWCFVAGHVEEGESAREAAARELLEETGLSPLDLSVLPVSRSARGLELRVFVARVSGSQDIRLDREHSAWRWSSFEEAKTLLPIPAQRRALALAQDRGSAP